MPRAPLKTSITAAGKTVGRPRKEMPPDAETRAQAAAADGASLVGICAHFGVSTAVFSRWMEMHPPLKEAIERGRESERQVLHSGLVQAAHKGNTIAAMFLLKSRHGYREGDQGDTANRVSITFSMPGALKPEQFTIENDTSTQAQHISTTRPTRS